MAENFEQDVSEDFSFKQMCKLRVFNSPEQLINNSVSFLCSSNKHGKIYVAAENEIKEIDISIIENITSQPDIDLKSIVTSYEHKTLNVGKKTSHIALSCDDLTLAVVFNESDALWVGFVDVRYFGNQSGNGVFFAKGQLSSLKGVRLREFEWHPEDVDMAAVCLSNGVISLIKITGSDLMITDSLAKGYSAGYTMSWSPRGINFVAGQEDGKLLFYDKKMELKKEVACPNSFNGVKHKAVKVKWIAKHNFAVVFENAENEEPPKFVCIVTQKDGPTNYVNMEDIYCGIDDERSLCYYMQKIKDWNLLVTMASNAFSSAVVAKTNNQWMQWVLGDSGRAEMPVSSTDEDTYPCGICINLNSTAPIQQGELMLPPAPIFMMISTDGALCSFKMVNKFKNANHKIMLPRSPMKTDNIRKPLISTHNVPKSSAQPAFGAQSLPKPFGDNSNPVQSTKETLLTQSKGLPQPAPVSTFSTAFAAVSTQNTPVFSFGSSLPTLSQTTSKQSPFGSNLSSGLPLNATITASETKPLWASGASTATKPLSSSQEGTTKQLFSGFGASKGTLSSNTLITAPISTKEDSIPTSTLPVSSVKPVTKPTASAPSKLAQSGLPGSSNLTSNFTFGAPASSAPSGKTTDFPKPAVKPESESSVRVSQSAAVSSSAAFPGMVKPAFDFGSKSASQSSTAQATAPAGRSGRVPPESRLLQTSVSSAVPQASQLESTFRAKPVESGKPTLPNVPANLQDSIRENQEIVEMEKELGSVLDKCIAEEIASFDDELRLFSASMGELHHASDRIGTAEEMRMSRENCALAGKKVNKFTECHVEHEKEALQLKSQMLKAFDRLEEARMQESKIYDKKYNALLKARSLDPVTARQRKEIRSQLNYITSLISDVNDSLDIAWEQAQTDGKRRAKNLKSNNIHNVYVAVESIDKIIDNLANQINAITLDAQKKQLISKPSSLQNSFSRNASVSSTEEKEVSKINLDESTNMRARVSPMKQSQLRAFLASRKETPVRRSRIESFTSLGPRAASTPAVNSVFKNRFQSPIPSGKLQTVTETDGGQVERESLLQKSHKEAISLKNLSSGAKSSAVLTPATTLKAPSSNVGQTPGFTGAKDGKSEAVHSGQSSFPNSGFGFSSNLTKPKDSPNPSATLAKSGAEPSNIASSSVATFGFGGAAFNQQSAALKSTFSFNEKGGANEKAPMNLMANKVDPKVAPSSTKMSQSKPAPASSTASTSSGSIFGFQTAKLSSALSHPTSAPSAQVGGGTTATPAGLFSAPAVTSLSSGTSSSFQPTQSSARLFGVSAAVSASTSHFGSSGQGSGGQTSGGQTSGSSIFATNTSSTSFSSAVTSKTESKPTSSGLFNSSLGTPALSAVSKIGTPVSSSGLFDAAPTASSVSTTISEIQSKSTSSGLFSSSTPSSAPGALFGIGLPSSATGIFGSTSSSSSSATASETQLKSTSSGLFGTSTSTSAGTGLFGSGTKTSSSLVEGKISSTSSPSTTTPAVQGKEVASGLFSSASSSSAQTGLFGGGTQASASGLFGTAKGSSSSASTTASTAQSKPTSSGLFGTGTQTSTSGLFGAKTDSSSPSTALTAQPKPTSTGLFSSATSSSAPSSVFGGGAPVSTGLFNLATSSSSLTATVSTASEPNSTSSSLFGSATTAAATSSLIGSGTKAAGSSLFGAALNTSSLASTTTSTAPPKPASTGLFGSATSSSAPTGLFGSGTPSSSTGLFGSAASSSGGTLFGSKPTESQSGGIFGSNSILGQPTTASSGGIFQTSSSSSKPAFGQSQSTPGSLPQQSSSGLGFSGFGLGGKPTNDPNKNPFGSVPSTATSTTGSSGFFGGSAGTSTGLFGSKQSTASSGTGGLFSKGFGSGFSSGSNEGGASAFGSASSGSAPFGGTPAFGGAPAFGSNPSFGGAPAFGSTSAQPGAVFGAGSSGTGSFGQAAASSSFGSLGGQALPSFGSLSPSSGAATFGSAAANQPASGFGNLGQQTSPFGQAGSSFGQQTSPPQGSSFSSWR